MTPKPDRGSFELLIEDEGTQGCLGHVPALPGLNFRADTAMELEKAAPARIREYAQWLSAEGLADLTPETRALVSQVQSGDVTGLRAVVTEHCTGALVWDSGNPAVLFEHDHGPLVDGAVAAHLRFVRRILDRMRELITPLSSEQRTRRAALERRSVDETLKHVGNCVWWYCSRIDDDLPEPEEIANEDPLDRIDRLFEIAETFLFAVPLSARATVHIPTRFQTADPNERWTHTKVCRRQAEHAWAHLCGLKRQVPEIRTE